MNNYKKDTAHCKTQKGRRRGSPRLYSPHIVTSICNLLVKGYSTNKICKMKGMPSRVTLGKWLVKYPEFAVEYLKAKQIQTYFNVDDCREIADDCDDTSASAVAKAKLQVDVLKWEATKMLPKIYGDKASLQIEDKMEVDENKMAEVLGKVLAKLNKPAEQIDIDG